MGNKKELEKLKLELMDLEIKHEKMLERGDKVYEQRNLLMHFFLHLKACVQQLTVNAIVHQQQKQDSIEGEVDKYLFVHNTHLLIGFFTKLWRDKASNEIFTPISQEFYEGWAMECARIGPEVEKNKQKIRKSLMKLIPKEKISSDSFYQ